MFFRSGRYPAEQVWPIFSCQYESRGFQHPDVSVGDGLVPSQAVRDVADALLALLRELAQDGQALLIAKGLVEGSEHARAVPRGCEGLLRCLLR